MTQPTFLSRKQQDLKVKTRVCSFRSFMLSNPHSFL
uniref:Uncharacterized protein n=1 Tax=Anguilla anguilla TaxID=7936 RepID=A0A0E9TC67_ANGAN